MSLTATPLDIHLVSQQPKTFIALSFHITLSARNIFFANLLTEPATSPELLNAQLMQIIEVMSKVSEAVIALKKSCKQMRTCDLFVNFQYKLEEVENKNL